ncbi:MAG: hypothetical protein ACLP5V_00350 [Candidatus Bathyarchaeia archaeon]
MVRVPKRRTLLAFLIVDLIMLMLVQFHTVHASTPIAFDSSDTSNCVYPSNCSTLTWSHTVGSGSNRILIVALSHLDFGGGLTATSVTFGATALSFLGAQGLDNLNVELWSLLNPPSGTSRITANFGVSEDELVGGSVSYFNVAGTRTPIGASGRDGTTLSVTVASNPNDLVVDSLCLCVGGVDPEPVSPSAPQTEWFDSGTISDGSIDFVGAGSDKPASSPVTMTWGWSTLASALIAVPLIPASIIPEYPIGLPLLTVLMIVAYGVIKHRIRTPKLRYPNLCVWVSWCAHTSAVPVFRGGIH